MARQWTDAQIGAALYEMKVTRNKAQIVQMIEYGLDGPEGQHLQLYLWEKLAEAGPHELTDSFARLVLEDVASPKLMKFGALGYLAYAPQEWMKPYATAALQSAEAEVKCGGFFLAGILGMAEHATANKQFLLTYNGRFSEYALIALAFTKTMNEMYQAFKASADDEALVTAMAVAKYWGMSEEQKLQNGGAYIKSGDLELAAIVLWHALTNARGDWLKSWHLLDTFATESQGAVVQYIEPGVGEMINMLGFEVTAQANGSLTVGQIDRTKP
ncbi:hypothetical protein [Permianibacter aggregans]|nr:hypothetical protein [Permianibacter aggregans]QGX39804.1 hypothetical protein E2H98_09100 [Permianibacter aggregans]